MLLLKDVTVLEACYEAGFESLSYFNKLFRKLTGENSSAFKKEACNQFDSVKESRMPFGYVIGKVL